MLFHDVTGDYYNPLTILSYALNYHFAGLEPRSYYLTNIVIHILNSFLIFFLVLNLLKEMQKKEYFDIKYSYKWLAFFCALAYAIHPMHVESVSWIAERKDVLYAFFYFLGMLAYIRYISVKANKYGWFAVVFGCFLLSLLSKPMAIVFPFSLLAMDILLKRDKDTTLKNIGLEKLPFLLIAIISVISTYHEQKLVGAVSEHQTFTLLQRFLFASYGFYMYLLKAFIPVFQCSYYPYPQLANPSDNLPFIFYLSPIIALLVVAIPIYFSYRSGENNFRLILFGLCFYFFNMIIVSQIISSGPNIMADRYSYICYFGIFFPAIILAYRLFQRSKSAKRVIVIGASLYMLLFSVLCYSRTLVWHNSETLWTEVNKQYPHRIVKAYNNLGNYYFEHRDLNKAYDNYKEAIDLKTGDPQVYCNMGTLLGAKQQYKLSLEYYGVALKIDSSDALTYLDRAITYSAMGQYDLAVKDYRTSARINPNSEILFRNIAYTYLNAHQFDSAINYYTQVIKINPANPSYFHYRGVAEFDKGAVESAMTDFKQNLVIAPHDSECMFYLSISYNRISDFNNAYKYAQMAQNARYTVPLDYIRLLKARLAAGE